MRLAPFFRVAQSLIFQCSICSPLFDYPIYFGQCIVCPFKYGSDYPFTIFKLLFLCLYHDSTITVILCQLARLCF